MPPSTPWRLSSSAVSMTARNRVRQRAFVVWVMSFMPLDRRAAARAGNRSAGCRALTEQLGRDADQVGQLAGVHRCEGVGEGPGGDVLTVAGRT